MNKIILYLYRLYPVSSCVQFCRSIQQVITLKDGSQIKGVLSGIENGVYTVKTPIIGDVHVAASDVASITNGNAALLPHLQDNTGNAPLHLPAGGSYPNMDQQIAASQQTIDV